MTKVPRIITVLATGFDTTKKHHRVPAGFTLPGSAVIVQGREGKNNKPSVIGDEIAVLSIYKVNRKATSPTSQASSSSTQGQGNKRRQEQIQAQATTSASKRLRTASSTSTSDSFRRQSIDLTAQSDEEQPRSSDEE